MNDPNSNCCPLSWDQRIPNEPILERQFLIHRPAMVNLDRSISTSQCTVVTGKVRSPMIPTGYNAVDDQLCKVNKRRGPHNKPADHLLMNRNQERGLANWWLDNACQCLINPELERKANRDKGLPTKQISNHSLKGLIKRFPHRPWLNGTRIDSLTESELFNLNYYNPKDCIRLCVQNDLDGLNREADQTLLERLEYKIHCGAHADQCHLWGNPTSPRMLETE